MREPCPDCGLLWEHRAGCVMYGKSDKMTSVLFGYPVCQCCGLIACDERRRVHMMRRAGRF